MSSAPSSKLPESLYTRKKDVPCSFAAKIPRRLVDRTADPHPFAALAARHNNSAVTSGPHHRQGDGGDPQAREVHVVAAIADCNLDSEVRGGHMRRCHIATQTSATLAFVALHSEECQTDISGGDDVPRGGNRYDWGSPKARPRGAPAVALNVSDLGAPSPTGGNDAEHALMSTMHHDHAVQRERIMAGDLAVREAKLMLMIQKQQVEHDRDIAKEREASAAMEELATRSADLLRSERLQHEVALNELRVAVEVARSGTEDLQRMLAATQEEVAHHKRVIAEHEEASIRASKDQSRRIVEAMEKHLVRQHDESEQRNAARIAEEQRRYKERREEWLRTVRQQPVTVAGAPPGDAIHNSQSNGLHPRSPSIGGLRSPSGTSSTGSADRSPRQALLRTSEWMSSDEQPRSRLSRNSIVGGSASAERSRRGSTSVARPDTANASMSSMRSKERRGSVAAVGKPSAPIRRVSHRSGSIAQAVDATPLGAPVTGTHDVQHTKYGRAASPSPLDLSSLTTPPRDDGGIESSRRTSPPRSSMDAPNVLGPAATVAPPAMTAFPPQAAFLRSPLTTHTQVLSPFAEPPAVFGLPPSAAPALHHPVEHRKSRVVSFDGSAEIATAASDSSTCEVDALLLDGSGPRGGRSNRSKSMFSSEALNVMKSDMHGNANASGGVDGTNHDDTPSSNRKMLQQRKEHATRQLESALTDVERLTKLLKERSAADTMIDAEVRLQACADALKLHYDQQHKQALDKVKQREREVAELFTVKVAALEGELQSMSNMVHSLHDKVEGLEALNETLVLRAEKAERTHASQTNELGRLHATLLAVDQDTMCCLCRESVLRDEVNRHYEQAATQRGTSTIGGAAPSASATPRRPTSAAPRLRGAMQVRPSPPQPRNTPQRHHPAATGKAKAHDRSRDHVEKDATSTRPREAVHPTVIGAVDGDETISAAHDIHHHPASDSQTAYRPTPPRGSAMDTPSTSTNPAAANANNRGSHGCATPHRSVSILQDALDSATSPFATGFHERVQASQRTGNGPMLGLDRVVAPPTPTISS